MEFKKRKEKALPILNYGTSGDPLKDCEARFIKGVKFSNTNIIPACKGIVPIEKDLSFYEDCYGGIMINLSGAWGSYTVYKNGIYANIIP